ncbi:MAG: DUF2029 domain-containing protein [Oscillochloris sp.]|nr:DUF2029 domain-containing protein [Oscillochloris sp.]
MASVSPAGRRAIFAALIALILVVAVLLGSPRARSGGDVIQPLVHARMLLVGADPLATPPADASSIPYPLTASTLLIPLAWLPPPVLGVLVILSAVLACRLLAAAMAPVPVWWAWLLPLAYLPLIFNLTLVQWAPPLLLALAGGLLLERRGHPLLAGLAWLPLLAKAQLVPILAVPLGATLLLERRWKALGAALAGWAGLLAISLALRPGWPLVWWAQTRPYTGGYSALVLAFPLLGLPLLLAALALAGLAWHRHELRLLLCALVVAASLCTPQRAIYEATALLLVISYLLRDLRLAGLVLAASWLILLQPLFHLAPELVIMLALYAPPLIGLWLAVLQEGRPAASSTSV